MTVRPNSLTEHPAEIGDLVSHLLRGVRLTGAVYYRIDASGPWPPIGVPVGTALAGAFGARTRNVLSYHVLIQGSCWTAIDGERPTRLRAGDVVVYPKGDPYVLADNPQWTEPSAEPASLVKLLRDVSSGAAPASFTFGDGGERTTFVCGFLGCDPRQFDPLLSALPAMLCVSSAQERLGRLVELALSEVDATPGSRSVRERLSESMFLETVRQYLASGADFGPLGGLDDGVVVRALELMHTRISRPWTLTSLADAVGTSRSVLAERFATVVGLPPMHYLTERRIQLAAQLLTDGPATVSAVAHTVGYGSEAAFSRAFKRSMGLSPGAWREAG
jgi:AraC-like DNA-binding protein